MKFLFHYEVVTTTSRGLELTCDDDEGKLMSSKLQARKRT